MSGTGFVSTLFTGLRGLKSEVPCTYSYQQGTNKLAHIEGAPPIDYGYDGNANITSESSSPHNWTYVYDLSNQLIRVLDNTNQIAEYTYNGAGQRIKKVTQTETRIFHYDHLGHLTAETNQSGQMLAEYIYLGDQLLAMIKPGESVYYFHNDHLGTPQILTDGNGSITWKATYTPFGEAVASIQTVENPFRFPGQYYDQETGLHYNYHRYYDPKTGRYVTPDPIGLEGGINLWPYTANNPVNWMDPEGLLAFFWHFGITAVASWNAGYGVVDSLSLSWRTMGVDFASGSQGQNWEATRQHAMAGRLPDGIRQTREQAIEATNAYVKESICSGNRPGAIHAAQDLATPGHAGKPWSGFGFNWETLAHIFGDVFPSWSTIKGAYRSTISILK